MCRLEGYLSISCEVISETYITYPAVAAVSHKRFDNDGPFKDSACSLEFRKMTPYVQNDCPMMDTQGITTPRW